MTIYTFYARNNKRPMYVAGTLDTETGIYSGEEADSIKETVKSARNVDIMKEETLFRAFYDGSRFWIRPGEPDPLVLNGPGKKIPSLRFSRSDENNNS